MEVIDNPRRRASIRDIPYLLLIFGVIFAASAICLRIGVSLNPGLAKENDLQTISASVQRAPYITGPCGGGNPGHMLHIFVRGRDGIYDLTQLDMGSLVPGIMDPIMNLRVGDKVIALVEPYSAGQGRERLWELRRNGTMILSYYDTRTFFERRNRRDRLSSYWAIGIASVFFLAAIVLRRKFGAWTDQRSLASSAP